MDETRKYSVLIVDDLNSGIVALSRILSPLYTVYTTNNGQDAVKMAEEYLPSVILLDILMPEMDGYAVISALKSSEKTRDIPVIFITGLGEPGDEDKGLSLGAADYITKPFSPLIVKLRVQNQIKMVNQLRALDYEKMQYKIAYDASNEMLDIMTNIFNKSDVMIYVTDAATDEMFFINDKMKQHFGLDSEVLGKPCYKVLRKGMTKRCDFCPCHQLEKDPNMVVIWEDQNATTNQFYRRSDQYVDWPGGKRFHIQHCIDITDIKQTVDKLENREAMLDALNKTAITFLSKNEETFENMMSLGMGQLVGLFDIDRFSLFRNFSMPDGLHTAQIYRWEKASGGTTPINELYSDITYAEFVPSWEHTFGIGDAVNGPGRLMPVREAATLQAAGAVSVLVVPVFIDDNFWGFAFFEDHRNERYFDDNCVEIMRSAAFLCANAGMRNDMVASIREKTVQLERALEQTTAASKAKGDFLSSMSHEMRTPMNAIIGMTAIGKKTDDIEGKNNALKKIEEASSHLLGVINDVLDMAKIEANKLELAPAEFNFEKMLQKVMAVVNFRIVEKRQNLSVNIGNNIPHFLVGDDQRLAQVITNLLSNAVKFTPEGGEIQLEAYLVGETDGNCELCIAVADNGIGISLEHQEKLFGMFEQAKSGISREYGGTGLGLVISKRIVELMGGRIWIESELGRGTRFIFTVKVLLGRQNSGIVAVDESRMADKGEFEGKKLLLAEDIEINREILIALLEDTGIVIECAENGKEALDMIEKAPDKYDIVFMDVQMPKMNGLEATRLIRALPALRGVDLPIIAMTANIFKDDIEACIVAGMDDHLGKPLDIDKVLSKLRKYLVTR